MGPAAWFLSGLQSRRTGKGKVRFAEDSWKNWLLNWCTDRFCLVFSDGTSPKFCYMMLYINIYIYYVYTCHHLSQTWTPIASVESRCSPSGPTPPAISTTTSLSLRPRIRPPPSDIMAQSCFVKFPHVFPNFPTSSYTSPQHVQHVHYYY